MSEKIQYEHEEDEDGYWQVTGSDGSVVVSGLSEAEAAQEAKELNDKQEKP